MATTRKEPDVLRRLSGLRAEEIRADEPRNLDDIERFLAHRLGQPGLRGAFAGERSLPAEEAIRRLREKSGGNFLWAEQALLGLESGTYDFARLEALPPGLTGLYTAFFERHFPDDAAYAPARQVLEVIVAAPRAARPPPRSPPRPASTPTTRCRRCSTAWPRIFPNATAGGPSSTSRSPTG